MPNGQILYPGTAQAGDVKSGKTFSGATGANQSGTMPVIASNTKYTPTAAGILIPAGYHDGTTGTTPEPNLIAANILSGKSIFGVAGNVAPKQFASGTAVAPSSSGTGNTATVNDSYGYSSTEVLLTVAGLTFQPSVVVITDTTYGVKNSIITVASPSIQANAMASSQVTRVAVNGTQYSSDCFPIDGTNFYLSATGFRLPVYYYSDTYHWYAWA